MIMGLDDSRMSRVSITNRSSGGIRPMTPFAQRLIYDVTSTTSSYTVSGKRSFLVVAPRCVARRDAFCQSAPPAHTSSLYINLASVVVAPPPLCSLASSLLDPPSVHPHHSDYIDSDQAHLSRRRLVSQVGRQARQSS
jgi:hypothetical protein